MKLLSESEFKTRIVQLILDARTEQAIVELADHYNVTVPKLKIGLPRGHKINTLGSYETRNETVSVLNGETFRNPSVVIHEFYHHLRTDIARKHLGSEKKAREFAQNFIDEYNKMCSHL
jgi:hypothetical protein